MDFTAFVTRFSTASMACKMLAVAAQKPVDPIRRRAYVPALKSGSLYEFRKGRDLKTWRSVLWS